jgi:hypothetical protein
LTKSYEIEVVEAPQAGSDEIYATAGGRYIKFADDGPEEIDADEAIGTPGALGPARARAAGGGFDPSACLSDIWQCFSDLLNGRSQTVNFLATNPDTGEKKYSTARKQAKIGIAQVSMSPQLQPDPGQPLVQTQPCLLVWQGSYYGTECPVITAPQGSAIVGANNGGGSGLVAAGDGNILSHNGGQLVAAGAGNLIGADGSSLIGTDGSSLVGPDGSSLVGPDGSSLVAAGGLNGTNGLLIAGGPNAMRPSTADLVAAGGLNLIGTDGSSLVAAGAGNLLGQEASGLVPENGLP